MTSAVDADLLTPEALLRRLRWRYATKRFDPTLHIDQERWSALEETLRLAPSSFGLQPWHFVVVTDAALKAKLRPATWNQPQVVDCSHLVVFAARKGLGSADVHRHLERVVAERKVTRESLAGFEKALLDFVARPRSVLDLDEWARRQVYLALGTFLAAAAVLGVDACPMEGFDPAQYDEILGLGAKGYGTAVIATAGRRAETDAYARLPKVRFDAHDVITHL